jgi:hypothetical protein
MKLYEPRIDHRPVLDPAVVTETSSSRHDRHRAKRRDHVVLHLLSDPTTPVVKTHADTVQADTMNAMTGIPSMMVDTEMIETSALAVLPRIRGIVVDGIRKNIVPPALTGSGVGIESIGGGITRGQDLPTKREGRSMRMVPM